LEDYGRILIIFVALVLGFLLTGLVFSVLRRIRLSQIQAMFRRYNDNHQDPMVITQWIDSRRSASRFLETLEYLEKINADVLALQVVDHFGIDRFSDRHVRSCLVRLFKRQNRREEALVLTKKMFEENPKDDSILDQYLDVHLFFGAHDKVSDLIVERIEKRFKGTTFPRHYARLLAARGNFVKAAGIMEKIIEREQALFRNTMGQPQKRLIGAQLEESTQLLEEIRAETKSADSR